MTEQTPRAAAVRTAFANQVNYCRANDAPITARIAARSARCSTSRAAISRRIATGRALRSPMPCRCGGGRAARAASGGTDPRSGADLPTEDINDAAIVAESGRAARADLLPWLDGPPQTNEAGRSSNFIAALLWLADQGLPPRFECFEIGSSAGINLMIDRYRYELGGVGVGPQPGALRFPPTGGAPPPQMRIDFAGLEGCDVAPVDLADPAQAIRLIAYIWPERTRGSSGWRRASRGSAQRPELVQADAADWIAARTCPTAGVRGTRVLMHSIVWQYIPADRQARITVAMEAAGACATAERPLAWVRTRNQPHRPSS